MLTNNRNKKSLSVRRSQGRCSALAKCAAAGIVGACMLGGGVEARTLTASDVATIQSLVVSV
jgi:hypothetical protein